MNSKKQYVTPTVEVLDITLEHSIAAGSALVRPIKQGEQILEETEVEHVTIKIDW